MGCLIGDSPLTWRPGLGSVDTEQRVGIHFDRVSESGAFHEVAAVRFQSGVSPPSAPVDH